MDFVGEGADVIIEGNARRQKKKESLWERDLRQGKYAGALDTVLGQKDSLTVSIVCHFLHQKPGLFSSY